MLIKIGKIYLDPDEIVGILYPPEIESKYRSIVVLRSGKMIGTTENVPDLYERLKKFKMNWHNPKAPD